jgi:hypothetical protein
MLRTTLIVTLLAAFAGAVSAAPRVLGDVEGSYELMLNNVQMPLNTSGFVRLRTCSTCDSRTHDVNAGTGYYLGKQRLPFADFSALMQDLRASASAADKVLIMVFYDLESSDVTRIVVHDHRG